MKEKKKSRPVLPSQKTNPLLLYHKTAKAFNPKQELFAEPSKVRLKAQTIDWRERRTVSTMPR